MDSFSVSVYDSQWAYITVCLTLSWSHKRLAIGPTVDTVISLSFWTAFQSVFMTVSGRTLQFECECLPRSRSHERLHNIVAYLHEDGAVASPGVQDLPFPLQRARFPSDGSARSCHVLVDKQVCSLQLSGVSHNCRLSVVRGEADDYIARRRTVLGLPPNAMGAHQVAGADLDVELVGSEFLDEPVGLLVRRLRQTSNDCV